MNQEWIFLLKQNILETTAIYLHYVENYSSLWNENNKKISTETLGKLILFTHQVKDIENYNPISEEEKTIITNCLLEIENYTNHIKNSLVNVI